MSLAAFQSAFADYLRGAADLPPAPISPARAQIYRNNSRLSLGAALGANFPVTQAMLGTDYFAQAARLFLRDHLPATPMMADYGAEFPAFLAHLPELDGFPFVPDVARAERAMIEALLAPNAPPLTAEAFAALPPDAFAALRFDAHPSTRLVRSAYAIADLWAAHRTETPDLAGIDPNRPQALLIARPDAQVEWQALESAETKFTSALLSGETIAEAVEELPENFDLTAALLALLHAGVFSGLILAENNP